MWYNFFGTLNTIFIIISLYGVLSQLQTILRRKRDPQISSASSILSLNQFMMSFFAYYCFFIYGYSIEPFNHFIVWPRLIATLLVGAILYEIWRDRRNSATVVCFILATIAFGLGLIGLFNGEKLEDGGKVISTGIILIVTASLGQGYYHQIRLIITRGQTGAVDLKMSQFILMMDISTIAFALSMGIKTGWPLLVLAIVSASTKLVIMYLFRWVRLSESAKARRALFATG